MTRRWSYIVVAAFSCLLALATSAHAECAWVLWAMAKGVSEPYAPLSAHDSRAECEERRAERWDRARGNGWALMCFPDTIDPRGPKGK